MYSVLNIHFQNIHTFTYQKACLHTIFCLFLKSSKAFSVYLVKISLKNYDDYSDEEYFVEVDKLVENLQTCMIKKNVLYT